MTPLVFLHGVGGGHAAWDDQVAHFAKLGYRVHAWDQPGYGDVPRVEPYDLERVSGALDALIAREFGEPVVLVGHSMGGLIAQETWARHPRRIRALALTFTSAAFGGGGGDFAREFVAARIGPLDAGKSMADIAASVMPGMTGTRSDPAGIARAKSIMSALDPQTYRKAVTLLTTFDRRAQLPDISVPTLLVAGSDDRTAPAKILRSMSQKIPGAEFVELEGCGHLGPMDQPGAFNAALEAFLGRHAL